MDDLRLRLRSDPPLLIELHGGSGPDDPLAAPLGGIVVRGVPGAHPIGPLDQPLQLAPQAAVLDLQGNGFAAALRVPRRVRVRARVDGVHARSGSADGAQDWLIALDFGDPEAFERGADGTRPLRMRLRKDDATILARAVHLPERLSLDLHVDPRRDPRDLGARLTGAVEGCAFSPTCRPTRAPQSASASTPRCRPGPPTASICS